MNIKKCAIEEVLPASVIQLIRVAPQSETTRAVVMAQINQPIPEGIQSFDAIKDWIEAHIDRPVRSNLLKKPVPASLQANNRIRVLISASRDEVGRCDYRDHQKGEGNYEMNRERLASLAAEADDVDEFWDRVREELGQDWEDFVAPESTDTITYSEYEQSDDGPENSEVNITTTGKQAIRDALYTLNVEEYNRLFN